MFKTSQSCHDAQRALLEILVQELEETSLPGPVKANHRHVVCAWNHVHARTTSWPVFICRTVTANPHYRGRVRHGRRLIVIVCVFLRLSDNNCPRQCRAALEQWPMLPFSGERLRYGRMSVARPRYAIAFCGNIHGNYRFS